MPNKAAAMSSPRGKGAASKKKASGERSSGYDHTRNDQRRGTRRVSSDKSGGGLCGGRCRVLGYTPRAPIRAIIAFSTQFHGALIDRMWFVYLNCSYDSIESIESTSKQTD